MSDSPQVDLSQIRGDWYFHMNYLDNAMTNTLKRAVKLLGEVEAEVDDDLAGAVKQLSQSWTALAKDRDTKDTFNIRNPALDDFLQQLAGTKDLFDAFETARGLAGSASIYDSKLEQLTEAVRQARGFRDDLLMMREQKP
jgi:hypothetical protein